MEHLFPDGEWVFLFWWMCKKKTSINFLIKRRNDCRKKHEKVVNEYKNKANALITDTKRVPGLLTGATQKAQNHSDPLDEVWNNLQLMFGLIKDWLKVSVLRVKNNNLKYNFVQLWDNYQA